MRKREKTEEMQGSTKGEEEKRGGEKKTKGRQKLIDFVNWHQMQFILGYFALFFSHQHLLREMR